MFMINEMDTEKHDMDVKEDQDSDNKEDQDWDNMSDHADIPPQKRGPGRPPLPEHLKKQRIIIKSPLSTSLYSGKPRGRPRVYDVNEFGEKVRIKRPVGRPPKRSRDSDEIKEGDVSDSDEAKSDVESPPSGKRPRGRPPKSPLTSTEKKLLVKFQKKRGRPPNPDKQRSAAPSSLTPGMKRRGRPPGALNKIRRPRWQTPVLTESVHSLADPDNTILRLTGRHFPEVLSIGTNLCQVCYNNNKEMETAFCCADCGGNPPLCAYPCFGIYHTVFRYWQPGLTNGPSLASQAAQHGSEDNEEEEEEEEEDEDREDQEENDREDNEEVENNVGEREDGEENEEDS